MKKMMKMKVTKTSEKDFFFGISCNRKLEERVKERILNQFINMLRKKYIA